MSDQQPKQDNEARSRAVGSNAGLGADKCCKLGFIGMDSSFIHESKVGAHPIVTVRFALDDWKSRDEFVKHFRCTPNVKVREGRSDSNGGLEPAAWRRTDVDRTLVTENGDIAYGWELDGLPHEALFTREQIEIAVKAEREACANVCNFLPVSDDDVADECAAAIRQRSNV